MTRRCLPLTAAILLAPALAAAQPDPGPEPGPDPAPAPSRRVDLEVEGADLAAALAAVARQAGANVVVAPWVEASVTASLRRVPWREAVERLARQAGCAVEQRDGYLRVDRPRRITDACAGEEVRSVLQRLAHQAGRDLVVAPDVRGVVSLSLEAASWPEALARVAERGRLRVVDLDGCAVVSAAPLAVAPPLVPARPASEPSPDGARVTLDGGEESLRDVLQRVGREVGANILLAPGVERPVRATLRDVPWRRLVDVLAEETGCEVEALGPRLLVVDAPSRVKAAIEGPADGILRGIAAATSSSVVVRPDVHRRPVAVYFRAAPWDVAARAVATAAGLHLARSPDGVLTLGAGPLPDVPAASSPQRPGAAGDPMEVVFEDLDLADAMQQLGERAEQLVLVDPSVQERVSVSLRGVTWWDAVRVCARLTRCQIELRAGRLVLLTQPPKNALQAVRAPLPLLLELLGSYTERPVRCEAEVRGLVTAALTQVGFEEAVTHLARAYGLALREQEGARVVTWSDEAERLLAAAPAPPPPAAPPGATATADPAPASSDAGSKERAAALGLDLDARIAAADIAARLGDLTDAVRKVRALGGHLAASDAEVLAAAVEALQRWEPRLGKFPDLWLPLRGEVCDRQGELLLRRMEALIRGGRYGEALAVQAEVSTLHARLLPADRAEAFRAHAEYLADRSEELAEQARGLEAATALDLSAVVVVPLDSAQKDAAIVNGRVLREAWGTEEAPVLDSRGRPIAGLRLFEIVPSAVRVRHRGVVLTVPLRD